MRYVFVIALVCCGTLARAGFTSGVENFSGNVLDTATWQKWPASATSTSIVQNNGLNIDTMLNLQNLSEPTRAGVTTSVPMVGVGQAVRTRLVINSRSTFGTVSLFLRDNSKGTTLWPDWDLASLEVLQENGGLASMIWEEGDGHGTMFGAGIHAMPGTVTFEIARLSTDSARFAVYDAGDVLLGQRVETLVDVPSVLNIGLFVAEANATFASVSVVPEPAVFGLLPAAFLLLRRARRAAPSREATPTLADMPSYNPARF
jgi:hypothetical protein